MMFRRNQARVISNRDLAYVFCLKFYSQDRTHRQKGICLLRGDEVQAAVIYDWFNGVNCFMHVAAVPGSRWMTREFLRATFDYPFNQLRLRRVSAWVEADNSAAKRFVEHVGFRLDGTLPEAGQSGVDVLIYAMRREDCRHV